MKSHQNHHVTAVIRACSESGAVCGTNAARDRRDAEARRLSKIDDLVDIEAVDIVGCSREL